MNGAKYDITALGSCDYSVENIMSGISSDKLVIVYNQCKISSPELYFLTITYGATVPGGASVGIATFSSGTSQNWANFGI